MTKVSPKKIHFTLCLLVVLLLVLPLTAIFVHDYYGAPASNGLYLSGRVASVISVSFFSLLTIVEIVSLFFDKNASIKTLFLTICVLAMTFTTTDFYGFLLYFSPDLGQFEFVKPLLSAVNFLSYAAVNVCLFSYLIEAYSPFVSKLERIGFFVGLGVSAVFYFSLLPIGFQFVGFILVFLTQAFFWVRSIALAISLGRANAYYLFIFLLSIFVSVAGANESLTAIGFYNGYLLSSLALCLAVGCYFGVYLVFVMMHTKAAYKEEEAQRKVRELQTNILKNQISPHYIFNALSLVKSLYGVDSEKGDRAIDLLSKNLRAYARAADTLLVPLATELGVVSDFVDLEKLKYDKEITVIYDIESDRFEVPFFSLQPLVENAIKYSRFMDKEDGYFMIHAKEEEDAYYLEVSDNGVGFDVSSIGPNSLGIKNVEGRFRLLLDASFTLKSEIGVGTSIEIVIPKKGEERK